MIRIGTMDLAWNDPAVLAVAGVIALILLLLVMILRASGRAALPLAQEMGWLGQRCRHWPMGKSGSPVACIMCPRRRPIPRPRCFR